MVWTFRGAEAPVQMSERRPIFIVKELPMMADIAGRSGRDLVIVRFDKKKDHRELRVTNGGNVFTFKSGISKDRTPDITVTTVSEGIFEVQPNQELTAGEVPVDIQRDGCLRLRFRNQVAPYASQLHNRSPGRRILQGIEAGQPGNGRHPHSFRPSRVRTVFEGVGFAEPPGTVAPRNISMRLAE